jgi:TrmH family RNA methyltransferase
MELTWDLEVLYKGYEDPKYIEDSKNLGDKIVILDNVQDPGNIGTIIRTAVAFNYDTIVLSSNSVNKYNEKVIRASQGMLFKINIIEKDLIKFIPELKAQGYDVYGTNVVNGINIKEVNKNG